MAFVGINDKTGNIEKISPQFKLSVLSYVADLIRSPKTKKELVDVLNKHIEFDLKDLVKRIPYTVSNANLATYVSEFLSDNNSAFNSSISALINRYVSKKINTSNANGEIFSYDIKNISNAIGEISQAAQTSTTDSEDGIKVALINKGINAKSIMPIENKIGIALLVIAAGLFIYALFFCKGEGEALGSAPVI